MGNKIETDVPWGTYAPPAASGFLRGLVFIGLARGGVSRWLLAQWRKRFPVVVDTEIRGLKYRLNISDNITDVKLLLSSKDYDCKEIDALSVPGGKVFIDVGANTGYYSLTLARRLFDRVIAIEPNPPTVKRLKYNVAINALNNRIKIVPLCVGDGGEVAFYNGKDLGSASLISDKKTEDHILVKSKPLYEIIKEENIALIDSMKIDVEGYEDQALIPFFYAAKKELWPKVIVLEHCHSHLWKTDLLAFFSDGKYQVVNKTRANTILRKIED